MANSRYTDEEICEAIDKANGLVTVAAKMLNITKWAIYKRAKTHPVIQDTIDMAREELVDIAEAKLREAIWNGEAWAISLTLKTIGKKRGYVERVEHTGEDGDSIAVKTVLVLPHNNRDEIVEGVIVENPKLEQGIDDDEEI